MQVHTQEARIILAIEAIRTSKKKMSRLAAAKIYNIPESTLRARMTGRPSRRDIRANGKKLTELEEEVIVNHILDLDSRGFSPRLADLEDMANYLLENRRAKRVGKNWAQRFVHDHKDLKTRINRVYDYQRALREDPELFGRWF
jgi:hypothetical protein